jgi:hypothetical protein
VGREKLSQLDICLMILTRYLYIVTVVIFLALLIMEEGINTQGNLPVIVLISLMRDVGIYKPLINEILLSSLAIGFADVSKVVVLHMLDRLSYLLLDLSMVVSSLKTEHPHDGTFFRRGVILIVIIEKVFLITSITVNNERFGSPSIYVRILLCVISGGSMMNRAMSAI